MNDDKTRRTGEGAGRKPVSRHARLSVRLAVFWLAAVLLYFAPFLQSYGFQHSYWREYALPTLCGMVLVLVPFFGFLAGLSGLRETREGLAGRGKALAGTGFHAFLCLCIGVAVFLPIIIGGTPPRRAKQSKSLNNIRQLSIAVGAYAEDNNDTLPGWVKGGDGRMHHNVWDEQIDRYVKSKDVYSNGDTGIRSPTQPGKQTRVLSYGLNGLLITAPKARFDGNGDWQRPAPLKIGAIATPAEIILMAELQTAQPMPAPYNMPDPSPILREDASDEYRKAMVHWIDIDPRAWVETSGAATASYYDPYGDDQRGVARNLYGGGGSYAFLDGHVKFMKIADTVGLGKTANDGHENTVQNAWRAGNNWNMWNPAATGWKGATHS